MNGSSPASSGSSQVMGHHEEWNFDTSNASSDASHGSEELDQLRFEVAHAKWHLSLYQAALMEVEGGIEAAAVQLEIVKEHHRPNCVDCERDQKWLNLAAARKHSSSPVLCRYTPKKRARMQRRSMST